jgi:tetratricopeptide (TPR) repeat protein
MASRDPSRSLAPSNQLPPPSSSVSLRPAPRPLAQLWQLPLLIVSLGLFGVAAWLLIDRRPALSIDQKIAIAESFLKVDRPDAGIEHLNRLLRTEKLGKENEARVHLLLAQALEMAQRQRRISIPANHVRIVEQTLRAESLGLAPTADSERRLAESFEALNRQTDALAHYRQAIALDSSRALRLHRKVIAMQTAQDDPTPALASIEQYLAIVDITDSERAWALGEKAQILADRTDFIQARTLLDEALRLDSDPIAQGELHYRLGYCAWKLGDPQEAERCLRVARDLLRVQHPVDADAAYLLGRLCQDRGDAAQASSFYQIVIVSHPESRVAPLARLGRGVCRILQGEDDAGLTDLHDLITYIGDKPARARLKADALLGLRQASTTLASRGNFQGALEVLAYEQTLEPDPAPSFLARLASVYERRADQVERTIADATEADKIRRGQLVRELRTKAGDAYVAYSRGLTLDDDKGYGEALWRGISLYEQAANLQSVVAALELFVAERPDDALAPDAMLKLGQAYQVAGLFDKAIKAFQQNQFRYPQSLAASKSAVPLAQAYVAQGPEGYAKAERVLLAVVDNNPLLTPEAQEFRQALFELSQLYYRTGRYEEAITRLDEMTRRYPDDQRIGQIVFLMADSYRKSAGQLDTVRLASATVGADDAVSPDRSNADAAEAVAAKNERLAKARELYDKVVDLYRALPPDRDLDKLYYKLSHFYRADCLYDLGDYDQAIRLYDAAAFRYQDDPSALSAYVQIVNAYCALGKIEQAKTANERAKWLLKRMPAESFSEETFPIPRAYFEQWLKWASASGMW